MYRVSFRGQAEQSHRRAVKAALELEHAIAAAESGYRRAEHDLAEFETHERAEDALILRHFPRAAGHNGRESR
jgi:hypothetical protein